MQFTSVAAQKAFLIQSVWDSDAVTPAALLCLRVTQNAVSSQDQHPVGKHRMSFRSPLCFSHIARTRFVWLFTLVWVLPFSLFGRTLACISWRCRPSIRRKKKISCFLVQFPVNASSSPSARGPGSRPFFCFASFLCFGRCY